MVWYRGRLSLWPIAGFPAGLVLLGVFLRHIPGAGVTPARLYAPELGLLDIVLGLAWAVFHLVNRARSAIYIDDKTLIIKPFLLSPIKILLSDIEGVEIECGILGRWLKFGNVTIWGTGDRLTEIRGLSDPHTLQVSIDVAQKVYRGEI